MAKKHSVASAVARSWPWLNMHMILAKMAEHFFGFTGEWWNILASCKTLDFSKSITDDEEVMLQIKSSTYQVKTHVC